MRELINILDTFLTEDDLGKGQMPPDKESNTIDPKTKQKMTRQELFLYKVINSSPFTHKATGKAVTIDPSEAKNVQNWFKQEMPSPIVMKTIDGETVKNTQLRKTTEFGGEGAAFDSAPAETGTKSGYRLKPKNIGITDRDIPGHDLYLEILDNPVLNSTDYGKIVIQLATAIVSGKEASVSVTDDVRKNNKLLAAIKDDAGEYLGVLALIWDRSRFPRKDSFKKWLGGEPQDLTIRFPGKSNFNLADSFAQIKNLETSHNVNISSKGGDGGAAPAVSGLKIPDHLKTNPKLKNAIEFITICQTQNTLDQAFSGIDLLYKINKESIDQVWHQFLPFSKNTQLKQKILKGLKDKSVKFGKEWQSILSSVDSTAATPSGKIIYAMKREVAKAINENDAMPEFKTAVLEILEMNFVQQYTDFQKYHTNEFTFETQWPAKLDGEITLENKSYAKDPTKGGFSFKLGRTDTSVSSEPGVEKVDDIESEPDFNKAAKKITRESYVGRKKRK